MQPTTSDQALQQLQTYQSKLQNPSNILSSQEQKLGAPAAQQQVSGLRQAITNTTNLLNQIPSSVYGRTANSLVTSGQAGRQIQGESAPVAGQLNKYGQQYGEASQDLNTILSRAQTGAQMEQANQQAQLGYLSDIYKTLLGKEQQAAALAEQQRQFNEQQAAAKRAAAAQSASLSSLLGGGTASATSLKQAPSLQDQAYTNVQGFLKKGRQAAESDYQATLKSANYGNPLDKLKVELYHRAGIGLGNLVANPNNIPGLSTFNPTNILGIPGLRIQ